MAALLLVLLLAVVLFGLGFAAKVLWWVALVVLAVWLIGFIARAADGAGGRRRWYRW
ncbi:hydrophobic protein [Kitasatospora sp. RB6PN24]|uniref:hydrophobic protein n=1 Tax=Kitasatospora humi TaxID=2893891 RepID=UPI001E5E10D2|nr:hydrophobic protein [Kitasatospora humi]MCC9311810.1 hydrophobic protein [Kitasatospora humi]